MPAAIALTVILAALAVFQVALALGAPLGRFAWGGQHRVLPAGLRVGSLVSIVVYAVIVVLALDKVGLIDVVPDVVSDVGMWVAFAYFVLGMSLGLMVMTVTVNFNASYYTDAAADGTTIAWLLIVPLLLGAALAVLGACLAPNTPAPSDNE